MKHQVGNTYNPSLRKPQEGEIAVVFIWTNCNGVHAENGAVAIDPRSDVVLAPGMTMTFEPDLRIPEWGGMQHSDTLVITPKGHEFLTTTRRGYIQV